MIISYATLVNSLTAAKISPKKGESNVAHTNNFISYVYLFTQRILILFIHPRKPTTIHWLYSLLHDFYTVQYDFWNIPYHLIADINKKTPVISGYAFNKLTDLGLQWTHHGK